MQAPARTSTLLLLAAAILVLTVGSVRAFDLGPGSSALDDAAVDHDQHGAQPSESTAEDEAGRHDRHAPTDAVLPTADNGTYSLRFKDTSVRAGTNRLSFTIFDADADNRLTQYEIEQDKRLHLIVVREDLTGFQHVHPRLTAEGTWGTREAVLDRPGPWRVIADFVPAGGQPTVLATTLRARGGRYRPARFRESERVGTNRWRTRTGPYDVRLQAERYAAGSEGTLRFTITRRGHRVQELQPYLGALGHAVLLRWGDVAYVHVHPREERTRPGEIAFDVTYPRAAPIALFLQFRHRDRIHTARSPSG